ncbi:MAG: hypothetical protein AABY13_00020 [Nanoarchaeota archaeon]
MQTKPVLSTLVVATHALGNHAAANTGMVLPKILKMANDPCFGLKHDQLESCPSCFLRESCLVCFRNKK